MQSCPLKELSEPSLPCLFSAALQPCLFESVREEVKALEKMVSGGSSFLHFPHPPSSLRASSGEEQSGVRADVE